MCVVLSWIKLFLKSYCYFHASLLFHEIYDIHSISTVLKLLKYLVKSKVKDKYSMEFTASRKFQPDCELLQGTFGY